MVHKPEDWLLRADMAYCISRLLFLRHNPYLWFDAAYLLHQALEKYGKALLHSQGRKRHGHKLSKLFQEIYPFLAEVDISKTKSLVDESD